MRVLHNTFTGNWTQNFVDIYVNRFFLSLSNICPSNISRMPKMYLGFQGEMGDVQKALNTLATEFKQLMIFDLKAEWKMQSDR